MVQKYQMQWECHPQRCLKGYAGKILRKCKYGFLFNVPQLIEELDEDGIQCLYARRCRGDQLVVPYNLEILLFWMASINIQRVVKHRFQMYLAKCISKPESKAVRKSHWTWYLATGIIVTQFAKTWHNDGFLEIQIFASVSSIYLMLCFVAISMLYCKYFSSYKAR